MSPRRSGVSRRKLLAGLGAGIFGTGVLTSTGDTVAFSAVEANRTTNVSVASGAGAILGIVGQGPVQKNAREAMVEFTNNTNEQMSITVTLDNSGDGTLYDNEGGSGSSVTFTLGSGNSQFVDIEAAVTGTIGYSVSASSPDLSIDTTGTVDAESGNVKGAVRIKKPSKNQDFNADRQANEFVLDALNVQDDDGDNNPDIDEIVIKIREGGSSGTVVGSKTITFDPPVSGYNPSGNPDAVIQPDSGYTIKSNTTYALTVTGYSIDDNFASETVEDTTTSGNGNGK